MGKLGDKLSNSEGFEEKIDESVWLLTLLINQGIMTHNIMNKNRPDMQKQLFTEDEVEILTIPADFVEYHDAIYEALQNGTARNVKSEEPSKNVTVG